MPPYFSLFFGGDHIPQPNPMVVGLNPHSYGPNSIFSFLGSSAQMADPSTYYIMSIYPYSIMSVPINSFLIVDLLLSFSVSSRRT
jgi:hypothetical protein